MLDQAQLEGVCHVGGGRIRARCPACAEEGRDGKGNHLFVNADGRFGCAANPGPAGREHRKRVYALAGENSCPQSRPKSTPPVAPASRAPLRLPSLRIPTIPETTQIAATRGLPFFAGLELAIRAGHLRCADMLDSAVTVAAWLLLDSSRRCAQARRLDGKPWSCIGGEKARTLRGSEGSWPIGAADIGERPQVALCEGGPDFLAAWSLIWWHGMGTSTAPVFVAGSHPMHLGSLPYFRGKAVWVFPHRDEAGARAMAHWSAQLINAGAIWVKPFDLRPHKDLNDWIKAVMNPAEVGS